MSKKREKACEKCSYNLLCIGNPPGKDFVLWSVKCPSCDRWVACIHDERVPVPSICRRIVVINSRAYRKDAVAGKINSLHACNSWSSFSYTCKSLESRGKIITMRAIRNEARRCFCVECYEDEANRLLYALRAKQV